MDHLEDIAQYMDDVLSGEEPACLFVKQAIQRQFDDLNGLDGYRFDPDIAIRVCNFMELMPHIKGKLAGTRIQLEPWQKFIYTTVMAWVDNAGMRRFKTAYSEIARKNSKSTMSSGLGLYCLAADNEGGAECYTAATTRDQARIVFNDAKLMAEKSPGYQDRFGVTVTAHAVVQESSGSSLKSISAEASSLDGLNVHLGIIDELHAHKKRDVWDVIETATGAREQPLIWTITTAGTNRTGICYEQREYVRKILSRQVFDEEYFGIIFTVDVEDLEDRERLLSDPYIWRKANPNYGVSVKPEDLERKARKAREQASAQNNFLTKHLNVWVNAATAWIPTTEWDKCADPTLDILDFEGQECVQGNDLASKRDIMAQMYTFEKWIDGKRHIYVFGNYYLPEEAVEESPNSQYEGWEIEGRLRVSPGSVNDFALLEDQIKHDVSAYNMRDIVYDPTQATYLSTRMEEENISMTEMRQTMANFNEPMKELEAMIYDQRIHHNGCPILTWMISNVVCFSNDKEQIYPRKEFHENKIDGVVALIMAIRKWIDAVEEQEPESAYVSRGARSL